MLANSIYPNGGLLGSKGFAPFGSKAFLFVRGADSSACGRAIPEKRFVNISLI
jgi:hypothetical protein